MSAKFVSVGFLLCLGHLAFGSDLAKEKETALKRISFQEKAVEQAYRNTCDFYNKGPSHRETIKEQKMDLGQSLRESNLFEVGKIAEGSKQKAKLLSSPPKVLDCINEKMEKAADRINATFDKGFVKRVDDLTADTRNKEQGLVGRWSDGYYSKLEEFRVQTDRTESEIKHTNSKAYVTALLAHFEKVANDTIDHILSLPTWYARSNVQFDRILETGPVKTYRTTGRRTIDELVESVNDCFLPV